MHGHLLLCGRHVNKVNNDGLQIVNCALKKV